MQNLSQALAEVISTTQPCLSDEAHICPHCEKVVPKMTVNILGVDRHVQPSCKCETLTWEQEIQEPIERKKQNDIESKFGTYSLGERFTESRFNSFMVREGAEKAAELARGYAHNFPAYGGEALLIWGEPGNGKSHLAAAICHTVKENGFIPVFQSVPELLGRIRDTFRKSQETEREIMYALLHCDLLVLDDVGAEKVTDWVQDVLFRIVDGRYRKKKPILYTSNLNPNELSERLGKRIYDRMIETSVVVQNKATSYRMEVARNRIKEMSDKEKKQRMWCE